MVGYVGGLADTHTRSKLNSVHCLYTLLFYCLKLRSRLAQLLLVYPIDQERLNPTKKAIGYFLTKKAIGYLIKLTISYLIK